MGQLQLSIQQFIDNKLNGDNPFTQGNVRFNLYNRYAIEDQDFYDVILNSVNWENEDPFLPPYEGFSLNIQFSTLAQLNAAGNEYKVTNVVYELFTLFGSVLTYFLTYDFSTNAFVIVNRDLPAYSQFVIDDTYNRLEELNDNIDDTKYLYMLWNTGEQEYQPVDRTTTPYNSFPIVTDYGFLSELESRGDLEQKTDRLYRVFREETLFELPLPEERYYVIYNSETGNYDQIAPGSLFNPKSVLTNNVKVEYDGTEYNTYLGQYTLTKVNYIPCIIEDFIAEYEPLNFVTNANYTIPITFYVNETIDRYSNNNIIKSVEAFYNSIRGNIYSITDGVKTYSMLLNHTALTPSTGVIDFNGTVFREYQLVVTLELIDNGYFGNQIQYNMSINDSSFVDDDNNPIFTGQTFRVYPITATSTRASELHQYQVFPNGSVVANGNDVQSLALPNETGFMLELSFLHDNSNFTKWLYYQKYTPSKPKKITLSVRYPNIPINKTAPSVNYVIESIGGVEMVGEKIIYSLVLKPVVGEY